MTDMETTRLCASAMGLEIIEAMGKNAIWIYAKNGGSLLYAPLKNNAQCMALGKSDPQLFAQVVAEWAEDCVTDGQDDLNRMVCLAFAKEHQERQK